MTLHYVFLSVPFEGHIRTLLRAAAQLAESERNCEIHFIVCGWPNVACPKTLIEQNAHLRFASYTYLEAKPIASSDPLDFNISRARDLIPKLANHLQSLVQIDAIVYDFFVIEALAVARAYNPNVPTYCSLAAFVPEKVSILNDQKVFQSLKDLGVCQTINECELLSDFLFINQRRTNNSNEVFLCFEPHELLHET
jgi:hypothetical protein